MILQRNKMVLPKLNRCCYCIPLEVGSLILSLISLLLCIAALFLCAILLPNHREQQNEDNVILLSMTMFTSLSAVSNIVALIGTIMKKPNYLQMSVLTNAVFIVCVLLVTVVTCLFSPGLRPVLQIEIFLALAILSIIGAAVYAVFYLTIVNSLSAKLKMTYGDSAIPV